MQSLLGHIDTQAIGAAPDGALVGVQGVSRGVVGGSEILSASAFIPDVSGQERVGDAPKLTWTLEELRRAKFAWYKAFLRKLLHAQPNLPKRPKLGTLVISAVWDGLDAAEKARVREWHDCRTANKEASQPIPDERMLALLWELLRGLTAPKPSSQDLPSLLALGPSSFRRVPSRLSQQHLTPLLNRSPKPPPMYRAAANSGTVWHNSLGPSIRDPILDPSSTFGPPGSVVSPWQYADGGDQYGSEAMGSASSSGVAAFPVSPGMQGRWMHSLEPFVGGHIGPIRTSRGTRGTTAPLHLAHHMQPSVAAQRPQSPPARPTRAGQRGPRTASTRKLPYPEATQCWPSNTGPANGYVDPRFATSVAPVNAHPSHRATSSHIQPGWPGYDNGRFSPAVNMGRQQNELQSHPHNVSVGGWGVGAALPVRMDGTEFDKSWERMAAYPTTSVYSQPPFGGQYPAASSPQYSPGPTDDAGSPVNVEGYTSARDGQGNYVVGGYVPYPLPAARL